MVDTANSSTKKHRENQEAKQKRDAREKIDTGAAVRNQYPIPQPCHRSSCVLMAIDSRKAMPPARNELRKSMGATFGSLLAFSRGCSH